MQFIKIFYLFCIYIHKNNIYLRFSSQWWRSVKILNLKWLWNNNKKMMINNYKNQFLWLCGMLLLILMTIFSILFLFFSYKMKITALMCYVMTCWCISLMLIIIISNNIWKHFYYLMFMCPPKRRQWLSDSLKNFNFP